MLHRSRLAVLGLGLVAALQQPISAQGLTFSLFERYLDSLRQQAAIPGLSAAVVQNGRIVWERGFGYQDIESSNPAKPTTPYPIADLTQTFAAVLLLQCVERGTVALEDALVQWNAQASSAEITVRQVMSHTSTAAGTAFKYEPAKYAWLTPVVDTCGGQSARSRVAQQIFDHLAMIDSVPGRDLVDPTSPARKLFDSTTLERYEAVLRRMATPYKVDRRGKATRSDYPITQLDATAGLVSTIRDLAEYDRGLDEALLLRADLTDAMFSNNVGGGRVLPTGLGWFVQAYNGEKLVWHFGFATDAYSSLIVKVPSRHLTLILLANSDGLNAPSLAEGDITGSLFALTFLRLFL